MDVDIQSWKTQDLFINSVSFRIWWKKRKV